MTEIATDTTDVTDTAEWVADDDHDQAQAQNQAEAEAEAPADPPEADAEDGQPKKVGVRQRLADAEQERDELRDNLAAANQALFNIAAERAGVQPELMTARGLAPEDFVDGTGTVNLGELVTAMDRERTTLGLSRKPQPNPVAGGTNGTASPAPTTFGEVLQAHVRGGGTT
jgi:hypothetical protein